MYLQGDRARVRKKENAKVAVIIAIFLIIILLVSPNSALSISGMVERLASFLLEENNVIVKNIKTYKSLVSEKVNLISENEKLKKEGVINLSLFDKNKSLEKENEKLRSLLGLKTNKNFVLAGVLIRPNRSLYDTFVVNVGASNGVSVGDKVYSLESSLIGEVKEIHGETSLISLFSTPGNVFDAIVGSGTSVVSIYGSGGASFFSLVPKSLKVKEGDFVVVPNLSRTTIGIVERVVSDPRDPVEKILINSSVSLQELTEVWIETK